MPDFVKSILGRPNLQPIDLLDLPIVDESFCFWGVYLGVILKNDTDLVEGVYVDSSLGYKGYLGISGRVAIHRRFSSRNYNDLPRDVRCYHYSVACKDDATPQFRTISLFEVIRGNTVATILAQQVLMVYLSTVAWAYPNQLKLFQESKNGIPGLPDFSDIGLNRALPLAQNQHWSPCNRTIYQEWLNETNQEDHCFNCGRPFTNLPDEKRWKGFFEARRCAACWLHLYKHKEEKCPDLITDARMHEVWVGWGNPDTAAGHRKWVEDTTMSMEHVVFLGGIHSHLVGWKGWKAASKCPACARQPTKKEDEEWMELYGDICAISGVDREYIIFIMCRTEKRACALLQTRSKRDETSDEVDEGALQD
ncbi:hypothetical protein FACUT_9938 [Fusarium acutatum]|uniref:Uncharacterized protein n=1 Tax=Fusarium acutatum TaxID=78861 RepID=A0A8H4JI28_9HYPO|nr:hypothetical protein FACUT_9938 [Fusarium acutatum]